MSWLLTPAACAQPTHDFAQVLDLNAAGLSEQSASLNVLPAGGFSLHDVYLVHNSRPNTSLTRRAGYVMRYAPAHSRRRHPNHRQRGARHECTLATTQRSYAEDYVCCLALSVCIFSVFRYMPSSSLFDPSRLPGNLGDVKNANAANFSRPIFLVRGSARGNAVYPGLVDATPQAGAPNPSAILAAADAVRGLY